MMLFLVAGLLQCASLSAHEIRPALLDLTQTSEFQYEAVFKQPQVQGRFLSLSFSTNCDLSLTDSRVSFSALMETFSIDCAESLSEIRISGLEGTLIDTMITIRDMSGRTTNFVVDGGNPVISTKLGSKLPVYFILGVEHLVFGVDHVLFVVLLMYLVKGWRNLVKVVTSFTVAHSITLGLSSMEFIVLSQAPVEAMIALSILLLALEVLRGEESELRRHPWRLTFLFGLLHGLGFAGALSTIGLPETGSTTALFLFNIGIEAGQLAIVALVLAAIAICNRQTWRLNPSLVVIPVYLVGGLSSYWFLSRSVQVLV